MIYLDASALVTYVTRRPNFAALGHYLTGFTGIDLVTSTVGFVETVRSCDATGSFPNLMAELLRDYGELVLTETIRDRAASLPRGLRPLDAIHVATAESLGPHLISFVTYDEKMARLARERRLPVESPGAG